MWGEENFGKDTEYFNKRKTLKKLEVTTKLGRRNLYEVNKIDNRES